MAPASTLPAPSIVPACSFTLVVSLNTSGAVHYVVVPNSPSLVSAASLSAAALSTQPATSIFPGTIAATGDVSVPQAFLNVTQTVTVGTADALRSAAGQHACCWPGTWPSPMCHLLNGLWLRLHVWLFLPGTFNGLIKSTCLCCTCRA